ncbi:uncharacterized protein LOC134269545 [Saccostrea cucullata]|uniref:uncharacterized protein LOC134269545 n=1 Tax=Saccostrea cuccullata TaxID=36930 RepID=UPI002ED44FAD
MDHIPRLSETVYLGLCREEGSPTEVRIRREVMDTVEVVRKPLYIIRGLDRMKSGSRREGFRLITSDEDFMFWPPDHKVICDFSQISLYRIPHHTVILMECDNLPPGFTRLNLMSQSHQANIISSCVEINNSLYISSRLFREENLLFVKTSNFPIPNAVQQGPCSTFSLILDVEVDGAFCLQSHHWPTSALPWIQRCREQGWPDQNVFSEILIGGFHVVPIGNTPENELEWRISFSRAEQKLVYSMNHCQFLCYGLFKLFLKEEMGSLCRRSPPDEEMLCQCNKCTFHEIDSNMNNHIVLLQSGFEHSQDNNSCPGSRNLHRNKADNALVSREVHTFLYLASQNT